MTADEGIIEAINACLKYEHTICACQFGYERYFLRWGFHGLMVDFERWCTDTKGRIVTLVDRSLQLGEIPAHEMWPFDVEPVDKASDINKVWTYFTNMLVETNDTYDNGLVVTGARGDSVTGGILGANRAGIQCQLAKFESKAKRVELIGPELYLAEHMHKG